MSEQIKDQDRQLPESSGIYYKHQESESYKSKAVKMFLWLTGFKSRQWIIAKNKLRSPNPVEDPFPDLPKSITTNLDVTTFEVEGRKVYSIAPKNNKTKKVVLYMHGNVYLFNVLKQHLTMVEAIVSQNNCTVMVLDFPLTPIHTYKDSYKVAEPLYKKIISENDPKDVILMGDSAGGGFCLGLAQKMKHDGVPQPSHIIMLSPWLDTTLSDPRLPELSKRDPVADLEGVRMAAESYTRDGDIRDYRVCPMYGDLEGLGRMSVFVSSDEMYYPDAEMFSERCKRKGVALDYYVYPKMIHVWSLIDMPESRLVLQQMKHCFE